MSINYNQTNISNFVLDIPDANITRAFKLNVQSALIPGLRIPVTDAPSGTKGLGRAKLPGSTIEFDPLVCRFLVDEEMKSWLDLYLWMISINNYATLENNGWEEGVLPKFITLHILNNTKTDIVLSIHYYGAWISDLSEIEYNYTEDGDPAVTCVATFNYKYYVVEKDGIIIDTRESIKSQINTRMKNSESIIEDSMKVSTHPSFR